MAPVTGAAGLRATGSVSGALIGRYRPQHGVVRTGSAEDRAQAYRRFLDAIAQLTVAWTVHFYLSDKDEGDRWAAANVEYHGALLGIRMCAPAYVGCR